MKKSSKKRRKRRRPCCKYYRITKDINPLYCVACGTFWETPPVSKRGN